MDKSIKIIKVNESEYLLFHGKSLSMLNVTAESAPELFNEIKSNGEDAPLCIDKELEEYLNSIPINKADDFDSTMPSLLKTLVMPISAGCNLACPYCFAQTSKGNMNFKDYTKEDVDRLLNLLVERKVEEEITLVFFGGEPMIRFDIIEYTVNQVKLYPQLKIGYSITTNGTLLTEKNIAFMKENNFSILISIDGMDNEFNYRRFHNGRSSVPRVLKAIEKLKKLEVDFEIRATITSDNPYVYDTYIFLEQLEVTFLLAFAYQSENKRHHELTEFNSKSLINIRNEFERLLVYYKECMDAQKPIYNKLISQLGEILQNRTVQKYECGAGYMYHTIMSDGTMYSCPHFMNESDCSLGNITQWPFDNLMDHDFIPVPYDEIPGCQDCWALHLCNGGCASQKYSMGLKANQPYEERKCELDKVMYEFFIKIYYEHLKHVQPE